MPVRLVLISDTHGLHEQMVPVPDGDVLIHAGDLTAMGSLADVRAFDAFLARLPHRHKIVIAGNHDFCFEREPGASVTLLAHATYLEDTSCSACGLAFHGSPWSPQFGDWAFMLPRGPALRRRWSYIPPGTDVLITHSPPQAWHDHTVAGEHAGCADLLLTVMAVAPRLHVFGHIHEGVGQSKLGRTQLVNASICTVDYRPANPPVIVDLV